MKATEIAIYRIKPEAISQFKSLRSNAMEHMKSTYKGFESESFYSSETDPDLFMDVIIWSSAEDFTAAAGLVMNDQALTPFLQVMAESIYFGHFHPVA